MGANICYYRGVDITKLSREELEKVCIHAVKKIFYLQEKLITKQNPFAITN